MELKNKTFINLLYLRHRGDNMIKLKEILKHYPIFKKTSEKRKSLFKK